MNRDNFRDVIPEWNCPCADKECWYIDAVIRHPRHSALRMRFHIILLLLTLGPGTAVRGQSQEGSAHAWLLEHHASFGLTRTDVEGMAITSEHTDAKGVTYLYLQQRLEGIPVDGAISTMALRNGQVVGFSDRFEADAARRSGSRTPGISAADALQHAARAIGVGAVVPELLEQRSAHAFVFGPSGIARSPMRVRLVHLPIPDGMLRLAWEASITPVEGGAMWSVAVDAQDGSLLRQRDRVLRCAHPEGVFGHGYDASDDLVLGRTSIGLEERARSLSGYRVFPFPTESPSHGVHALVSDPADPVASPFGWHDPFGGDLPSYTITRGNNVWAYEDTQDLDEPGYSPDGGADLLFDHPYLPGQDPQDYLDASITNLFHACNVIHDVLWHYGFDEAAGNFQESNFSGLGAGMDPVLAEAQDGGGTNNATFSTPEDGEPGRMQMFIWSLPDIGSFTVNAPEDLAGPYAVARATFGPPLPEEPITADIVLAEGSGSPLHNGCTDLVSAAEMAGKIALVDRGQCTFIEKVLRMQDAGAIAVIVVNNQPGAPIAPGGGGGGDITIPTVMVSQADGSAIKLAMEQGVVNATLVDSESSVRDSGFDNGVIAHEYGHGLSIRLTGGAQAVDCLWNDEQMGEGWSDYLGVLMSMRPDDGPATRRGVGTYLRGQSITGQGIRPAPYTTDMAVNGFTYGSTNSSSITQPHGIGFVWGSMLWDLTWALIDVYGYDEDLYSGTGGNNLALQLVVDGLKLQPCSPGFVDGRDAILLADQLLTGGENECLIWTAFARRGLGLSASQGDPDSRFDQEEAFDLPVQCISVGLAEQPVRNDMRLMPNPATGQVRMVLASPAGMDAELRILAADGRVARTLRVPAGSVDLAVDIAGLAPALYLVELRSEGTVLMERLVVE